MVSLFCVLCAEEFRMPRHDPCALSAVWADHALDDECLSGCAQGPLRAHDDGREALAGAED